MFLFLNDIPEAESLSSILSVVESLQFSDEAERIIDFSEDQIQHFLKSAEHLGLVKLTDGGAELTDFGRDVIVLDKDKRRDKIKRVLLETAFLELVLAYIEKSDGVRFSSILKYMEGHVSGPSEILARRLQSNLNWLRDENMVDVQYSDGDEITDELYFFNNKTADWDDGSLEYEEDDKTGSIYPADYGGEELDIKEEHIQVYALMRKREQGKILIPEFQRHQVWKQQQKSRFIESLILNIPVPPLYVSQDLFGNSIIIDGLQRSTAIAEFFDNKFALMTLEALPELNGRRFADLDNMLKARIEDRNLLLYTLKPSVPLSIVYDIFNRINSNGTALTRQEIRNCIFIGKATRLLKELSESEVFRSSIDYGIPWKRMKDREAILRFFSFVIFDYHSDYKGDMDSFLGRTMRRINNMEDSSLDDLRGRFFRVMKLTHSFFGNRNFRLPTTHSRGRVNIAIFETICYFFDQHDDSYLMRNADRIKKGFFKLIENQDYKDAVRLSTSSEKNVKLRFRMTRDYLEIVE